MGTRNPGTVGTSNWRVAIGRCPGTCDFHVRGGWFGRGPTERGRPHTCGSWPELAQVCRFEPVDADVSLNGSNAEELCGPNVAAEAGSRPFIPHKTVVLLRYDSTPWPARSSGPIIRQCALRPVHADRHGYEEYVAADDRPAGRASESCAHMGRCRPEGVDPQVPPSHGAYRRGRSSRPRCQTWEEQTSNHIEIVRLERAGKGGSTSPDRDRRTEATESGRPVIAACTTSQIPRGHHGRAARVSKPPAPWSHLRRLPRRCPAGPQRGRDPRLPAPAAI